MLMWSLILYLFPKVPQIVTGTPEIEKKTRLSRVTNDSKLLYLTDRWWTDCFDMRHFMLESLTYYYYYHDQSHEERERIVEQTLRLFPSTHKP